MSSHKLQVCALFWLDAASHPDHDETLFPIPCLTFGIITEETDEYIRVAGEVFADGQCRSHLVVPKGGMNPRIILIKKISVPPEFEQYPAKMLASLGAKESLLDG